MKQSMRNVAWEAVQTLCGVGWLNGGFGYIVKEVHVSE